MKQLIAPFWLICLSIVSTSTFAQVDDTQRIALDFGISRMIGGGDLTGFHSGVILPSQQEDRFHRLSFDFRNIGYTGVYYPQSNDPLVIVQDSGYTHQLNLTYGFEERTTSSDQVSIYYGIEFGAGYLWNRKATRSWEDGNLSETPVTTQDRSKSVKALVNPFVGCTVWLSDGIGLYGQGWFMSELFTEKIASETQLQFNASLELRIGITLQIDQI